MKKLWKIAIVLIIIGIIGAAYGWFFVYNKPHRDFEKAKADFSLNASECFLAYADVSGVEDQYTGKVLEITGKPSSIESSDSLVIIVFAFREGMFGDEGIRCTVLPNYNDAALSINKEFPVTIKGFCAGYNGTDVILEQCSLVE